MQLNWIDTITSLFSCLKSKHMQCCYTGRSKRTTYLQYKSIVQRNNCTLALLNHLRESANNIMKIRGNVSKRYLD